MRRLFVLTIRAALGLGCGAGGEREVVLTRADLGDDWPLAVNSATVLCSDEGSAVPKLGPRRYALDDTTDRYPHAREVARAIPVDPNNPDIGAWPADTEPLRAICDRTPDVATR